jgi:hypothetical protein
MYDSKDGKTCYNCKWLVIKPWYVEAFCTRREIKVMFSIMEKTGCDKGDWNERRK